MNPTNVTAMRLSFIPVGGYLTVIVLAVALLALLFVGMRRRDPTGRRRRVLLGLRLAVVLLVLLALLRPTVVYTQLRKQTARLLLLLDNSRSMQVADAVGDKSRWQALTHAVEDAAPALDAIAEDFEVKAYTFAAEAQPLEMTAGHVELPREPTGDRTAIGAVLQDVLRQEAGKRLAGVILLSDGAQRAYAPRDVPPQSAARQLADQGYPLHTMVFGQSRGLAQARDVALESVRPAESIFVKNELTVPATVRIDGFVNRDVGVELLFETAPGRMEVVDADRVRAVADGQHVPIQLQYAPQLPGEFKLMVRAIEQPGEMATDNNHYTTFVTVRKGGLNVLYLEGAVRAESRFIRDAIDASANINVEYVRLDARRPQSRPSGFAELLEPGRYDVYLIGDLDSRAFRSDELESLAEATLNGAGLLMCGGFHSFGPGGYQQTALADILPIEMDALERQNFDEPIATDMHLPPPVYMRPTPFGVRHFVMQLAAGERNLEVWQSLPPLEGANRFRRLKPRAQVLAADGQDRPLLVAHDVGRGRVMAFAGDSTWRWVMAGQGAAQKRFWRQMILWLAHKEQATEGLIDLRLAGRRFGPGQQVDFQVAALSPEGEPVANAAFEAEVILPDDRRQPVRLVRGPGGSTGSFYEAQREGDYTVEVTARRGDEMLGTARARFLVESQDLELANPAADPSVLSSMAAMTGGESLAPEELSSLITRIQEASSALDVETETKQELYDTWPFMLLLVGLLGTEWWLRKRWGLV